MVKFCRICPNCKKTYTNGAIETCGVCRVDLREIEEVSVIIDGELVKITYKLSEVEK